RAWITPRQLSKTLSKKIHNPALITIAYSTNGGFTPMNYRHLADELAFYFAPQRFAHHYKRSRRAAGLFAAFLASKDKTCYAEAAKLEPAYRGPDNSLGMLYLAKERRKDARKEFELILAADPHNPCALFGLGRVLLDKKSYAKALPLLRNALRLSTGRFKSQRADVLHFMAQGLLAARRLNSCADAARQLRRLAPLNPYGYYFAAETLRKRGHFKTAARHYRSALQLGLKTPDLMRALKTCAGPATGAIITRGFSDGRKALGKR
ncbi:MAG TPA: tetratricopeptide repeat protein, partial [Elusimicrobiales bacterium]|nr:tetratricopeptide repeat protein [Elusimicrobiales bacterium]